MKWDSVQKQKRVLESKLNSSISTLSGTKSVLESDIESSKQELESINSQIFSKGEILKDINVRIDSDKVLLDNNLSKRRKLVIEERKILERISTYKDSLQDLKAQQYAYQELVREKSKITNEIAKLTNQKVNMLEIVEAIKKQIDDLQIQRDSVNDQFKGICKLLEEAKIELDNKKAELEEREKNVARNEETLKEREIDLSLQEGKLNKEWERFKLRQEIK